MVWIGMSEEPWKDFKGGGPKPEKVKTVRVVVVTAATEKLFWFVLGIFCGCNWLVFMVSIIGWVRSTIPQVPQ